MPKVAAGVVKFQQEVYPKKEELFETLAGGQSPETLFITCSDSRISPNLVTQSDPGEVFIIRNAGNIVAPHTKQTDGGSATIEYAVAALKVKHIVVCGHTGCGAMGAAMDPSGLDALPHVKEWIGYSRAAVQVTNAIADGKSDDEKMLMLIEQNVLLQLQHLRTHPYVAQALAAKEIELHGWVYDIKTGGVTAYDHRDDRFEPVAERYADDVSAFAGKMSDQDH